MRAPWTAVHDTPNKSIRQNVARRGVVLHHAAMTSLSGLRDMEVNGTKQVSSTAICKDDAIELVVSDDRYRPWSLSSSYWDSAMRSVETCNDSTAGWTISDRSHWSLAKAVAYWASTDGFWPHRDGDPGSWTVIGHREVYSIHGASYATACPGGLDLGLVTARAQQILKGGTAGLGFEPIEEEDMLTFITDNPLGSWYATNGSVKWPLAPGENQLLVDLGLAKYPSKPGGVHVLSPAQVASIPTRDASVAEYVDDIAAAVAALIPEGASVEDITAALVAALKQPASE